MPIFDIQQLKDWFRTGLKPTQAQFWALIDSYWHKQKNIPLTNIEDLPKRLKKTNNLANVSLRLYYRPKNVYKYYSEDNGDYIVTDTSGYRKQSEYIKAEVPLLGIAIEGINLTKTNEEYFLRFDRYRKGERKGNKYGSNTIQFKSDRMDGYKQHTDNHTYTPTLLHNMKELRPYEIKVESIINHAYYDIGAEYYFVQHLDYATSEEVIENSTAGRGRGFPMVLGKRSKWLEYYKESNGQRIVPKVRYGKVKMGIRVLKKVYTDDTKTELLSVEQTPILTYFEILGILSNNTATIRYKI